MMSSSPDIPTRTTGAHRAHREARDRAAAHTLAQRPPERYEPYLDGLFTYCLSVLCDHDDATAAVGDVLGLAERRTHRVPAAPGDLRAWLYALTRWACLRRLAEAKQKRPGTHAAGRPGADRSGRRAAPGQRWRQRARPPEEQRSAGPPLSAAEQRRRQRELAVLAWPEAAGTSPEQREALELAVRHHLAAHEVAAVLGMDLAATRDLLASAACEVERTRAALAVAQAGGCPAVARLTGDGRFVLSATLRRELVRHVDDCPRCRRIEERAMPGRWPGSSLTPAELPVVEAPRAALHVALAHVPRARGAAAPRFDRRGFPMDPRERAARRERLRARAVTTTVVATVVAAPVLAVWAACRSAPPSEDSAGGPASTGREHGSDSLNGKPSGDYENAGNAAARTGSRSPGAGGSPGVSVDVVSVTGAGDTPAGHLDVAAETSGDTTLITLTATGAGPVTWSATTRAGWLRPSRTSGTLAPGESLTIRVHVDRLREPSGHWSASLALAPAGVVVTIEGYGTAPAPSDSAPGAGSATATPGGPPTGTASPDPAPTSSASGDPTPGDPSSSPAPDPTPTATGTAPSDRSGGSTPQPGGSTGPGPSPS
ncbi:BACON domain-containing protein [Streptomyces sp. MS06]|uniref:BACON domain-containing protein n=1 Tax=Streptomyces sp. MS06 TaxID=3385974 RepID=UPI0039A03210